MARRRALSPQSVWDEPALTAAFEAAGVKTSHVPRLYRYLLQHPEADWSDVPGLPKAAQSLLAEGFAKQTLRVVGTTRSRSGEATKLLIELQDGLRIESVIMIYDTRRETGAGEGTARGSEGGEGSLGDLALDPSSEYGSATSSPLGSDDESEGVAGAPREGAPPRDGEATASPASDGGTPPRGGQGGAARGPGGAGRGGRRRAVHGHRRATLCVSSEVGCAMGCTFCATGTMGLRADLTAGEIVEQVFAAKRIERIRNIVFMGMGEPLNNYASVVGAVRTLSDGRSFALRRSAITVSTVGVIPRIRTLSRDLPGVSLALSLHAPNQELRKRLVPSARAYKLGPLMEAVDSHAASPGGSRVFVEYVLLGGTNDSPEHARELGTLLRGRDVSLNLIPWNPVLSPTVPHSAPSPEAARIFSGILRTDFEIPTTLRAEKGQDVSAACGQLVVAKEGERATAAGGCSAGTGTSGGRSGGDGVGATAPRPGGAPLRDMEDALGAPSPRPARRVGTVEPA